MGKGYTKDRVLAAIKDSNTIITVIARKLDCSWDTARKYVNKWEVTRTAYENERQKTIDFAEGKLFKNIDRGDMAAIKYFLSKKAKDRGYGDEPENAQNGVTSGANMQIEIIDTMPTPNALDAILEPPTAFINSEEQPQNENKNE